MNAEDTPFSVLMSLYNKESASNLEECFRSLKIQTLLANEIIVVIDGEINSDLQDVLNRWEFKLPLKIFPLQRNVGLGNALNIGLKKCSFEIVLRMDTDDICYPNRFEIQIEYLISHPEVTVLGTAINEFDKDGLTGQRSAITGHENIIAYSKKRNPINHMTVAFRKSKIIEAGGYQHHQYMEDYNLWLRLISMNQKFENITEPLVYARVGDGMLARRKGIDYVKSEYSLWKLKRALGIDSGYSAFGIFILRVTPRLMPIKILSIIYKKLRVRVA